MRKAAAEKNNIAHLCAIALGGNIGNPAQNFAQALDKLAAGGFELIKKSSIYKTAPVNCAPDAPDFSNAAVIGTFRATAEELLKLCQKIERELGRPEQHLPNSDRTIDLDIVIFGDEIINNEHLKIPHPRSAERFFVLAPLAEIAPEIIFPDSGLTAKELFEKLPDCGIKA